MSFPNIIFGEYGDEKVTSSTRIGNLPLGAVMVLGDGREFVHARASATALVAGDLYQSLAGIQSSDAAYRKDLTVATAATDGGDTIGFTAGATTAVTEDMFRDGFIFGNDVTGQGNTYKIRSNTSAAAGSTFTVTLYKKDTFQMALAAGTSCQMGISESPYYQVSLTTADTVRVGPLAGIAPVAVTANYYCWLQRKGMCAALTDGTLVIGTPVVQSAALAGAVAPHTAATTNANLELSSDIIGYTKNVAASTEYSLIDLNLP